MNSTRTLITLIFGFLFTCNSFSQQEPRSAFFWNQYMHTNPAMTGAIYKHHANAQWRNQWTKVNGAPTTLWLNYAAKIDKINSGIGASYEYGSIGFTKSQTALVSYAYHIPIKKLFLSVGASAGIKTLKINFDKTFKPVFQCDFGLALRAEKWNIGLSVTQLEGSTFRDSLLDYIKDVPHIWLFADYAFQLGEKWKLTPRIQSYSDLNKTTSSLALIATFKENLWFGATASIPNRGGIYAVGPMIGYDIVGKFRLGYTYEVNLYSSSNTNLYGKSEVFLSSMTHEIILSYQLK